jgi:hypothetical protein
MKCHCKRDHRDGKDHIIDKLCVLAGYMPGHSFQSLLSVVHDEIAEASGKYAHDPDLYEVGNDEYLTAIDGLILEKNSNAMHQLESREWYE